MRFVQRVMVGLLVAAGLWAVAAAQQLDAIDVEKLGPQVGAQVPPFSLTDQTGRLQTLQSVMGPKGTILVFFRSADW
jgi:hypothetical protein